MATLVAVAAIVVVLAALSVYGPPLRQGRSASLGRATHGGRLAAHQQVTRLAPVPQPAAGSDPLSRLVGLLRRRPGARVALSALSIGLLVGAVAAIGYPFYTNLLHDRLQGRLDRQLASPDLRQAYLEGRVQEGQSLTRIVIPAIDVSTIVVSGISDSALRAGAGHYPQTPLPCEIGNVGIAGHRTTYGRPFHNLHLLEPGDEIILQTPIGTCTYQVAREPFVVAPDAWEVVANTPGEATLTLTTCHPKGSLRERLIVRATLAASDLEV